MILAIETATRVCSVAVGMRDGQIEERRTGEYGQHSEKLFEFIKSLQNDCGFEYRDLDVCLISEGPGSYTGLRIGASGVKGLLFGLEVPLTAVNTLAAVSWGVRNNLSLPSTVHATVDARRKHLYHQVFEVGDNSLNPLCEPGIRLIENINEKIEQGHAIAGTGWRRLNNAMLNSAHCFGPEKISARSLIDLYVTLSNKEGSPNDNAAEMGSIMRKVEPAQFDPNYITTKKPGT